MPLLTSYKTPPFLCTKKRTQNIKVAVLQPFIWKRNNWTVRVCDLEPKSSAKKSPTSFEWVLNERDDEDRLLWSSRCSTGLTCPMCGSGPCWWCTVPTSGSGFWFRVWSSCWRRSWESQFLVWEVFTSWRSTCCRPRCPTHTVLMFSLVLTQIAFSDIRVYQ